MNAILNYLRDTRGEVKHISWPTQKQTIIYTSLVISVSIITSIYIGVFDFLFTEGLSLIVN